jgi:signal transduction histidine kinase
MAISHLIGSSLGFRALIRHRARRADRLSGAASRRNGRADRGTLSQAAGCGVKRMRNLAEVAAPGESVVRELSESDIRLEERSRERARIVHELHDTLLQGFIGASMVLHQAVEQTPADSPSKPALSRALHLVHRAIDEGRAAMRGLRTAAPAPSSLEEAFSNLLSEVTTERGPRLRIFIQGKPRALSPAIQDQLCLIGREAVMNALRHSEATEIEVEVQYRPDFLRVFVRDNGCGINPEAAQKKRDSHWGLRGMRDRAENIGARFEIRSRPAGGTEVGIAVPSDLAGH